jgi:hypothetical protein
MMERHQSLGVKSREQLEAEPQLHVPIPSNVILFPKQLLYLAFFRELLLTRKCFGFGSLL